MKKILLMLSLIAAGFIIVALPDSDKRLFSISKNHGPSLQDAIGLFMILIGYAWFLIQAWNRKERILKYKQLPVFKIMLGLLVLGLGFIVISVTNDYGNWWVCGAIVLILIQTVIFYIAIK